MKHTIDHKFYTLILILFTSFAFSQDRVLVSDRLDNAVNIYSLTGDFIEVYIASGAGGISNPQDIVFHPNGSVLLTGLGNENIKEYNRYTGEYIGEFSSGYALQGPTRMVLRPDGFIYVLQWTPNYKVIRFNLDGTFESEYTNTGVVQSIGAAWDEDANLYVSSYGGGSNGTVTNFDPSGNEIGTFVDSSELMGPTNIWFDPNGSGNMHVLDFNGNRLSRFDPSGNFIDHLITGISNPEGFVYLPNGNLLICERGADMITEFDSNFNNLGRWDDPSGALSQPNFIATVDLIFGIEDYQNILVFLAPSVGIQFRMNPTLMQDFKTITIYDYTGRPIEIINLSTAGTWNAIGYSDGIYFVIASSNNGQNFTQKIIVENR